MRAPAAMIARSFVTLACLSLAVMFLADRAEARPWTDPNGRLTFEVLPGWDVETNNCPDCTYVLAFNPNRDCHVVARPRTAANALQPQRVRAIVRDNARITPQIWTSGANAVPAVFPSDSAQFVSQTVDDGRFWPIQRAELRNAEKTVHAAFQLRPQMELWAFCVAASGTATPSEYDAFFRSIGTPNDAALQQQVVAAEATAAQPAPAPAAQPAPDQEKERRHRH